jgi:hypothetical protein
MRSPQAQVLAPAGGSAAASADDEPNVVDIEQSTLLGGVVLFAKDTSGDSVPVIASTTTGLIVSIQVDLSAPHPEPGGAGGDTSAGAAAAPPPLPLSRSTRLARARRAPPRRRRPIRWTILDNFQMTDAHIVSLVLSQDRQHALAGFSNGHIRVVDVANARLHHVLSSREAPDLVVAAGRWVVASNLGTRPCPTCWDRADGRAMHRWERSSVGWEEVAQIVAISPTARKDCFAVWDGRSQVRVLNAAQGRFTRIIDARGSVIKSMTRSVKDEAEFGAAASHVGPSKMAISADGQTVFVAASNRVIILDIHGMSAVKRAATMKQLDGARRALLALSTDNRYVVTAEGDVFGGLASRFATGPSRSQAAPCICVWDAATGELRRRITEVGYISDLSVANNCIAVVAAGPKRLSQNEPSMVRGEVLVFRFDTAAA